MSDEKTGILARLRHKLESEHGCTYNVGHKMYFFSFPYIGDRERQLEAYALDSAYAALAAEELVVRFRSYIQLKDYRARLREIRRVHSDTDSAEYMARRELEDFLKQV